MSDNNEMYVFHYSNKDVLVVLSDYKSENDEFSLNLPNKNKMNLIKKHDPIATISKSDKLRGGQVISTKPHITVMLDKKCPYIEKRLYKRIPVSLIATFKVSGSHMRHVVRIKDISKNGLQLYCDTSISVKSKGVVEIVLEGKVIFIQTEIVRKNEDGENLQYGSTVPSYDIFSLNNLDTLLKTIVAYYQKNLPDEKEYQSYFDELESPNTPGENVNEEMLNYCTKRFEEVLKRSKY